MWTEWVTNPWSMIDAVNLGVVPLGNETRNVTIFAYFTSIGFSWLNRFDLLTWRIFGLGIPLWKYGGNKSSSTRYSVENSAKHHEDYFQ